MSEQNFKKFIDKSFIYAIVGATINKEKYGYKVLADLKEKGYNVVPVNPKYEQVAGLTCYPDLLSLEERPDVVVLIVPPVVSLNIIKKCADLALKRIWLQPGAEDKKVIDLAKSLGLEIVVDKCIMIETNNLA